MSSSFYERKDYARKKLEGIRDEYGVDLPTFWWEISSQKVDWQNANYCTAKNAGAGRRAGGGEEGGEGNSGGRGEAARDDSESIFTTGAVLQLMREEVESLRKAKDELNLDVAGLDRMQAYVQGLEKRAGASSSDLVPFTVDGRHLVAYVLDESFIGTTLNSDPTGTSFWGSALVLAKVLEARRESLQGKRACELGAGLGVCGIAAWMLGCSEVVLTDNDDMILEVLRLNVSLAYVDSELAPGWDGSLDSTPLAVQHYAFGDDASLLGSPFDLVLCADLVYGATTDEAMAALVSSCFHLVSDNGQVITATAVREGGSQATDLCRMMEAMGMAGVEVRLPAGGCPGEMAKEVQVVCWERKRA